MNNEQTMELGNNLDSLSGHDPRSADPELLCVPKRVLKCGDMVFHENKGKKGTWHVPGGSTMTTKEVESWAKRNGIFEDVKAEIKNFYYRKE